MAEYLPQQSELQQFGELTQDVATQFETTPDMPVEQAITTLIEVAKAAREANKSILLKDVEDGVLTRRRAGELLDVHPITISRWITARAVQTESESS